MENKKDHYRNVFKSDHLGSADLEDFAEQGKILVFTIKHVKQEKGAKVAGKKMDANIAYFVEPIKPLVLNAGNSKIVKQFTGSSFVQDWNNVLVELYVDENVKSVTGGITQGIRIRQIQPKEKLKPAFSEHNFPLAKKANATKDQILKSYSITEEMYKKYLSYESTAE
jgi:hypothetical protein